MLTIWVYSLISVLAISLISFVGLSVFYVPNKKLTRIVSLFVSFSAGALMGDAFIHLLPEVVEANGFGLKISLYIISGVALWFVIEKVIHWHHCHTPTCKEHIHTFAIMNLLGDGVHNFVDGLIIGASYMISLPIGITTTLAVILHEIPQEIGDFGVLLYGGFSKSKALFFNFLTALWAVVGVIIAIILGVYAQVFTEFLIAFAAGSFIYIAGSDLIPELHKEVKIGRSIEQFIVFVFGVLIMILLLFLG